MKSRWQKYKGEGKSFFHNLELDRFSCSVFLNDDGEYQVDVIESGGYPYETIARVETLREAKRLAEYHSDLRLLSECEKILDEIKKRRKL